MIQSKIEKKFTCAVVSDVRQVSLGVKRNRLITGVVACHVTFSAVDAKILKERSTYYLKS